LFALLTLGNILDAIFRRITKTPHSGGKSVRGYPFLRESVMFLFRDIFSSALLYFDLLFPTLTYTTFTLKTLKG